MFQPQHSALAAAQRRAPVANSNSSFSYRTPLTRNLPVCAARHPDAQFALARLWPFLTYQDGPDEPSIPLDVELEPQRTSARHLHCCLPVSLLHCWHKRKEVLAAKRCLGCTQWIRHNPRILDRQPPLHAGQRQNCVSRTIIAGCSMMQSVTRSFVSTTSISQCGHCHSRSSSGSIDFSISSTFGLSSESASFAIGCSSVASLPVCTTRARYVVSFLHYRGYMHGMYVALACSEQRVNER